MTTALDIIKGSLRLIGQLAEGEEPSPEAANDGLTALNQMIDSWSTERLAVFTTQDQTFTWAASTASHTLGPTGSLVGLRPVLLDPATYFTVGTISYPLAIINEAQYNSIVLKGSTSPYPTVVFVRQTYPDATVYVYPVPSAAVTMHFVSVQELTQPAILATTLAFPPGYFRAFRFNLACELAAEWGVEPSTQVQRIAMTSKRDLKRINNPQDVLDMPYLLLNGSAAGRNYNIFTG